MLLCLLSWTLYPQHLMCGASGHSRFQDKKRAEPVLEGMWRSDSMGSARGGLHFWT